MFYRSSCWCHSTKSLYLFCILFHIILNYNSILYISVLVHVLKSNLYILSIFILTLSLFIFCNDCYVMIIIIFYYLVKCFTDPATGVIELQFGFPWDIWDWQEPETYVASIACSHEHAITSTQELTVTFTNQRDIPVSDLPATTAIPETQLSADGDFHCVSGRGRLGCCFNSSLDMYNTIHLTPKVKSMES